MKHSDTWLASIGDTPLYPWLREQSECAGHIISAHGDYPGWSETLLQLSHYSTSKFELANPVIQVGTHDEISADQRQKIRTSLLNLHPWRKGPFDIFGIHIDSEWRSDLKWQRLAGSISPLQGRRVLDVGCGNGYFMLRMLGDGASWVLGIDPTILFNVQFAAVKQFISQEISANIIPVGIDQLPDKLACFDTVFSMGILYHRRSPIDHLYKLFSCLRPGGELVLETLVIDGTGDNVLLPSTRYAKMRNVWFIPTAVGIKNWLRRCGFNDIHIINISTTSVDEQRSTDWMKFESLKDFLDPGDQHKTIEGYPAPARAILIARRPA